MRQIDPILDHIRTICDDNIHVHDHLYVAEKKT